MLPVGVETITASARYVVRGSPSTSVSRVEKMPDSLPSDHHVVQRVRCECHMSVGVGHLGLEHHPAFDPDIRIDVGRETTGGFLHPKLAHETHSAHVDRDNRN